MPFAGVRADALGPLAVEVDGRDVVLTARQRALLSALLLDLGRVVSVERLADRLWGEDLPAAPAARIRALVAEVRRALGPYGPAAVVTRSPGYLVPANAVEAVADTFEDLVRQAAATGGLNRYDAALALWRGEPYQDLNGPEAEVERQRLREARAAVAECRAGALSELGRHPEAIAELARLLIEHPLRERPHLMLMRALRETGRLSEALEVYEGLRRRLVDELGAEPGPEARRLHQELLQETSDAGGPELVPRQLPPATARFVGRDAELKDLDDSGVTLVVGPAGVGKTALALHWAHRAAGRYPDGQLFLDLRGFDQGEPMRLEEALPLLLQGLGVASKDVPVALDGQVALYRSLLAGKRVLIVLDDAAEPAQVRRLLPTHPGCRVLVTSRDRLGALVALDGAERLTLDALTRQDALSLVARVAGARRLRDEPEEAARLVELCDRSPLALSIALSWIGEHDHRTIGGYVRLLAEQGRLARLRVEGDESVAVRAALDLSHETLAPAARRMFRLYGLAPGTGLSSTAAAAMAGLTPAEADELLGAAARVHLLRESGPGRFTAHDLVAEYAAERAREDEHVAAREAALRRLFDHYLHAVVRATRVCGFDGPKLPYEPQDGLQPVFADAAEATAWLDAEWDNLVAVVSHAAAHGPAAYAWRLVEALQDPLHHLRTQGEWTRIAEVGLAAARGADDLHGQAAMHYSLGLARWRMTDLPGARREYERALALSAAAGWTRGEAAALQGCGVVLKQSGRPREAIGKYERAVRIHRELGSIRAESRGLNNLAVAHLMLARLDRAEDCLRAALKLTRRSGDRHLTALTLVNVALVRQQQARFPEALEALGEALDVCAGGLRFAAGVTHETFGWVYLDLGDDDLAAAEFSRALELAQEVENRRGEIAARAGLSAPALGRGAREEALGHLRRARDLAERTGTGLDLVLVGLVSAHLHAGAYERALADAEEVLALALTASPLLVPRAHTLRAAALLGQGRAREALAAAGEALARARRSGQRLEEARALNARADALERLEEAGAAADRERAAALFTEIGVT
ncbi:ATP-binding protein [Nonomuraea longicatena]|uniref:BTAD domain-containing putative transcriptional regulator n=1 Tax=Nonomuraea longicatena TaxID=83682 RepID=A0ABP3ZN92_9ACTN